jgi:hypothetical protein
MRMDIENSPGAQLRLFEAAARHDWGHAGRPWSGGGGAITGICLRRMRHSANLRGERAGSLVEERGLGVL